MISFVRGSGKLKPRFDPIRPPNSRSQNILNAFFKIENPIKIKGVILK